MPRIVAPQVSFAEVELKAHIKLDPILKCIGEFLEKATEVVAKVRADLTRGLKRPQTGRDGMDPVRVLRAFVLSRIKNWELRELSERIADGNSLRVFTTFCAAPVPSFRAFGSAFSRLTPETIREINEAVVRAAVDLKVSSLTRRPVE